MKNILNPVYPVHPVTNGSIKYFQSQQVIEKLSLFICHCERSEAISSFYSIYLEIASSLRSSQ
jgi:hypothetical protein